MHTSWPKIRTFKDTVAWATRNNVGKTRFEGRVKIHGTNASVVHTRDGEILAQSRSRIITPEDDNYGFAAFVKEREDYFRKFVPAGKVLFGEWAGPGVQQKVASSQAPHRFFATFALVDPEARTRANVSLPDPEKRVIDVPVTYTLDVDFKSRASIAQAKQSIYEATMAVEAEDPLMKAVFGISGIGEGLVWTPEEPDWKREGSSDFPLTFKSKGDQHAATAKKVSAPKMADDALGIFAEQAVQARALQAVAEAAGGEYDVRKTGDVIRWMVKDVTEEEQEAIRQGGWAQKDVSRAVGNTTAAWYREVASRL